MEWDDPPDSLSAEQLNGGNRVVAGVNMSMTAIRASTDDPVLLLGLIRTVGSGGDEDGFVVASVMDFRALPGFATGTAGTITDTQIAHHIGGADDFKLAGDEC